MRKISLSFYLMAALVVGGAACSIVPDFPVEPRIEYRSISVVTVYDERALSDIDIVTVSLSFQDGDGDLGYEPNSAPPGEPYSYTVERLARNNGVFQPTPSVLSGHITPSLSGERTGPIEGVLDRKFELSPDIISPGVPPVRDTIKYRIRVIDRAGHVSNTIETDPVVAFRPR